MSPEQQAIRLPHLALHRAGQQAKQVHVGSQLKSSAVSWGCQGRKAGQGVLPCLLQERGRDRVQPAEHCQGYMSQLFHANVRVHRLWRRAG